MAKPAAAATPKAARRPGARKTRARKTPKIQDKTEQPNQPTLTRQQINFEGFTETYSDYLTAHRNSGKTLENASIMDVVIWGRTAYTVAHQRGAQGGQRRTAARKVRGGDKKANTDALQLKAAA